ncbi:MAG: phosphopantothenoylcysteine synthase [Spirochaetaceae bacterium]|nr:phosphopantothenoylcysteine synthase [Spirochaetaceae bacterium]
MVTSGGTREKIDDVRCITNLSTGTLGSLICGALAGLENCEKIFYVCGIDAALPRSGNTEIIPVSDTISVINAVKNILSNNNIDAIIHAMAVSDYRVKSVRTGGARLGGAKPGGVELERGQKISSNESEIILVLEPTPKVISLFNILSPRALLVGFKLLCNVTEKELIDTAYNLLQKNSCAFVIANDKNFITETKHKAYLIDKNKNYTEFETKKKIANGIADKLKHLLNGLCL